MLPFKACTPCQTRETLSTGKIESPGNAITTEIDTPPTALSTPREKAVTAISESIQFIRDLEQKKIPYSDWPENLIWKYYAAIRAILNHPKVGEVRNAIFERNRDWVERHARSYASRRLPACASVASVDDLIQDALLAMYQCIDEYDLTVGTSFQQYINSSRIRGAIIDGLRRLQEYPREIAAIRRKVYYEIHKLQSKRGRNVNVQDLIDEKPELREFLENPLVFSRVFNQTEIRGDDSSEEGSVLLQIQDNRNTPESMVHERSIARHSEILSVLRDKMIRSVIYQYYILEITQQDIAFGLEIPVMRVKEYRIAGVKIIREHLGRDFFRE